MDTTRELERIYTWAIKASNYCTPISALFVGIWEFNYQMNRFYVCGLSHDPKLRNLVSENLKSLHSADLFRSTMQRTYYSPICCMVRLNRVQMRRRTGGSERGNINAANDVPDCILYHKLCYTIISNA